MNFRRYFPPSPAQFAAAMNTVAELASEGREIPREVAEVTGWSNGSVCVLWKHICDSVGEGVRAC